ncbi:uncharacterized protein GGS22DRAFT_195882 [Annulohypoxylon maeteangense]|uniref:uncharacterized protein n=1 Tax=Annulohypoxylon maeteangense TaxID=1927788 RepID=UPI0020077D5E|nr:uncharacterized protein GGS22DRAFT_195882 [Annulohypoxylon maeteangense]KAI0882658.1 hypothetical protein GGS22DRAFT_195882 [Annulohypoxylon maeteangense]
MPRSKAVGRPEISLVPSSNENDDPINISAFKELFTFIDYRNNIEDPTKDHPDVEDNRVAAESMVSGAQFSAMFSEANSSLSVPSQPDLGLFVDDSDDEEEYEYNELSADSRVVVVSGCPPSAQNLNLEKRVLDVVKPVGFDRPKLYFENLCCAAIEQQQLNLIKSAKFVTDVDTMWGIFATLHTEVTNKKHGDKYKRNKGLFIAVEVIDRTVFMKILNLHNCDDWDVKIAATYLRKEATHWCYGPAVQGGWKEPQETKTFKRVISYAIGDIRMVIQDEKQALSAHHDASRPHNDDLPAYTAVLTRGLANEQTQMLPRKRSGKANPYIGDVRLMSYLWLSQSQKAFLYKYIHNREARRIEFFDDFELFNASSRKRSHPKCGSDDEDPEEKTKVDQWTEKKPIKKTILLLHRILGQIKEQAQAQAEKGVTRFILRQGRKMDKKLEVVTDAPHLTVRLLSPAIRDELAKVEVDNSEDDSDSEGSGWITESSGDSENDENPDQGGGSGTNEEVRTKRRHAYMDFV